MLIYDVVEEIPANNVNSGSRLQLVEYTPTDEEVANILYDTSSFDNSDRNSPPASTGGTRGTGAVATTGGTASTGGTSTTPVSTGGTGAIPQTRTVTVNGVTYTINTLGTPEESDDSIVIDGVTYAANSYINRKEEEARQQQLLNNGAADGSTGEKSGPTNPTPEETKKVEVVEPCIQKTDESGSTGGNASTGGAGGTGGNTNKPDDTTPIAPRIVKRGKQGTFKSSIKNKNAPLIFVVGGVAVKNVSPGDTDSKKEGYMWTGTGTSKTGYNDLQDFNIYNCFTSNSSKNGWSECEKILNEQKIKPSKYILVLYSGGVSGGHNGVLTVKKADTWDQIHISGPPLGHPTYGTDEKGFKKYLDTINKAGKDKVYYWVVGTGADEGATRTDWKKQIIDSLPPSNVNTSVLNHYQQVEDVSQGIKKNNPIEAGTKAEVIVTEPAKPQPICDDLTKVEAKKKANEGPQGGAEVVTEARETSDGQQKPADPKPPPKTENPVFPGKLNHRFYLTPTPEGTPTTLQDMLKAPWSNRFFAWRPESGPGFGDKSNESLISTPDGKPLVSGMIPYWPPLGSEETNGPAGKKGKWIQMPSLYGSWSSLTSSEKPISVFEILMVLNAQDVGHYNKKIGYLFEAGNELHMTIMPSSLIHNLGKGPAIGTSINPDAAPIQTTDKKGNVKSTPAKDSSWALIPQWDSYFARHCLEKVGYTVFESIENINSYHLGVIKRKKTTGLVNTPGQQKWKIDDLVSAGTKDGIFKPSKIWTENLNSQETIASSGDMAIFVADYHFTKDGKLTEAGEKLVNYIISDSGWTMATISTVSHHSSESSKCHIEVLPYMDRSGKLITIGGNITPQKSDPTLPPKSTIAIRELNFAEMAGIDNGNWVNGSVIITSVKGIPLQEQRLSFNMDSQFYKFPCTLNYIVQLDSDSTLNARLYNIIGGILTDDEPPPPPPAPSKFVFNEKTIDLNGKSKEYIDGTLVLDKDIRKPANGECIGELVDLGSKVGIWGGIKARIKAHWNAMSAKNPMYSNCEIGGLGSMRPLFDSTYTKSTIRICGSKHGIGIAHDLTHYFPNLKPVAATLSGLKNGPALFQSTQWKADFRVWLAANKLTGGVAWSLPDGDKEEPHHIEAPDPRMPEFLYGCRQQLAKQFGLDYKKITSTSQLVYLYENFCGVAANKYAWENGFNTPRKGAYKPPGNFEYIAQKEAKAKGIAHVPWKKPIQK